MPDHADDLAPDPPGSAALRRQLDVAAGARWREGNVVVLVDAPAPLEAVELAGASILLALDAQWGDAAGQELALAVATRARTGVTCRVLVAEGLLEPAYLERLERMGCEVRTTPPELLACSFVVADATAAALPGASIAGPFVRDLVGMFQRTWLRGGGSLLGADHAPALDASGHAHVALVTGRANVEVARRVARTAAQGRLVESPAADGALVAGGALVLRELAPAALLLVDERATAASVSRHFARETR